MIDQESCATQTDAINDKVANETISTQTDFKLPTVTSPTPKSTSVTKKPPKQIVSSKEETQLLATVRGMRVDLAIKEKALQRLTRELDECKKTIRKLLKENEGLYITIHVRFLTISILIHYYAIQNCIYRSGARMTKKPYDPVQFSEANGTSNESQLQEKIKLLEMDYKTLHEKRLVDVSASILSFSIISRIFRPSISPYFHIFLSSFFLVENITIGTRT